MYIDPFWAGALSVVVAEVVAVIVYCVVDASKKKKGGPK